jgi:hypothetical protein
MSGYTGFKNTAFKVSNYPALGLAAYKGRTICYENGHRLWQKTSLIWRRSRGDALRDAQQMSRDAIMAKFDTI